MDEMATWHKENSPFGRCGVRVLRIRYVRMSGNSRIRYRKDKGMKLQLPPGYYLELDPDILMLRRKDDSVLGAFSARGAIRAAVEMEAWVDYQPPTLARHISRGSIHPTA